MIKNKPKILYIVTQGHWGGAQKYIFDLAENAGSDFEITVAVGEPNVMPDLQKKIAGNPNVKLVQLSFLTRNISPLKDTLAIVELANLYKKIKPDIIHLNSTKTGVIGSLAFQASGLKNTKLIYTVHGWVFNEPMSKIKKNIYKIAEKVTFKAKDKIIVLSEKEKKIGLQKLNVPEKKMEIIPIGINPPQNPLSKSVAQNKLIQTSKILSNINLSGKYVIGTIANFYPTKNLDNLIRAISKTTSKIPNLKMVIIGDGQERKLLEDLIIKFNLQDTVYLTGFLENANQYMPAFDLFVLPSRKEGLPYTLLEAKINKTPIIATNVGSISDIIENKKTGLLISPENEQELHDAILYAFLHQEEMKQMAETGRNDMNDYSKENTVKKTISLYRKLLQSN